jgi:pimeloyl-ACP methyl ester carboxylesterase
MIRTGTGEPLVLLHGVLSSERVWDDLIPHLAPHYDTIALTLLGHRGGRHGKPGSGVADVVDDAEAQLDALGLDRPHLVGHSLGGWIALELARRGRARTVCALSPAGCWDVAAGEHEQGAPRLREAVRQLRRARWLLPLTTYLRSVRRRTLREVCTDPDRVSRRRLLAIIDDLLGCELADELLHTTEEVAPMDPLPCPVTIAWAEADRVLPIELSGARARKLMPAAAWTVLPRVGHLSMADDPELVAETIRDRERASGRW